MAVARSGSSNFSAVHVWLIVFVVLWLGSTVWLVIMYTNQQQHIDAAKSALAEKRAFVFGNEANDPTFVDLQSYARTLSPAQPLARVMLDEIHTLAGRITGDNQNSRADAEARIDATLKEISDDKSIPSGQVNKSEGLIRILGRMYALYTSQRHERENAEKQLKDTGDQLATAQKTVKELTDKFDDSLGEMKKQVADLQQSKLAFESTKSGEISDLEKRITAGQESIGQMRKDMMTQQTTYGMQLREKDATIREQLEKISVSQGAPPLRAQEDALAREPVGRVLRALPGDSLVHIDLGEMDGVTLGMRFSVYSGDRRVPADGRGKASIEVVSVGPHTSECRVVTAPSPDDPILDGDGIQNIILSKNKSRKQRFVIVGDFDIDYDRRVDPQAPAKIRAYIERFGGEVVNTVDATTDYVVVGQEPAHAAAAKGAAVDPAAPTRDRDAQQKAQTYEEAVARAQVLNVPRLRQEVFLNFVGLEPGRSVAQRLTP